MSDEHWKFLDQLDFRRDGTHALPPNSIPNEKPRDMSKTCWYCHVDNNSSGEFFTTKSTDPIPKEILQIQEKLGFIPGEPITPDNLYKIIPTFARKPKSNNTCESSSQANETTPLQTASPKGLSGLKRKCDNSGYLPFKKYASGRYDSTVPKANSQHHSFEYKVGSQC